MKDEGLQRVVVFYLALFHCNLLYCRCWFGFLVVAVYILFLLPCHAHIGIIWCTSLVVTCDRGFESLSWLIYLDSFIKSIFMIENIARLWEKADSKMHGKVKSFIGRKISLCVFKCVCACVWQMVRAIAY